eukprot:361320-Chlamydomonas_euryale.AAC.2
MPEAQSGCEQAGLLHASYTERVTAACALTCGQVPADFGGRGGVAGRSMLRGGSRRGGRAPVVLVALMSRQMIAGEWILLPMTPHPCAPLPFVSLPLHLSAHRPAPRARQCCPPQRCILLPPFHNPFSRPSQQSPSARLKPSNGNPPTPAGPRSHSPSHTNTPSTLSSTDPFPIPVLDVSFLHTPLSADPSSRPAAVCADRHHGRRAAHPAALARHWAGDAGGGQQHQPVDVYESDHDQHCLQVAGPVVRALVGACCGWCVWQHALGMQQRWRVGRVGGCEARVRWPASVGAHPGQGSYHEQQRSGSASDLRRLETLAADFRMASRRPVVAHGCRVRQLESLAVELRKDSRRSFAPKVACVQGTHGPWRCGTTGVAHFCA